MGKIRVKTIGDGSFEQEDKNKLKEKREQKKMAKVAGMKGGERTTSVGVSEEEIAAQLDAQPTKEAEEGKTEGKKSKKEKFKKVRIKSKRHQENLKLATKETAPLARALENLRKFRKSTFDETVELHINTREKGINGTVILPHGTGKQIRVKIADDAVIAAVETGKIDFDVLVATPQMMPKLAKVAKILGPRGLMPNPKNGTITDKPEAAVEKLQAGQVGFKTESSAPIIHMSVGKLSFDDTQLADNIKTIVLAVGSAKINSITLKSTMSPAVKLNIANIK